MSQLQFSFDKVLFFGRSVAEYRTMLNFEPAQFTGARILDCSSGPAALAAQAASLGLNVVACDPMYADNVEALRARADEDASIVDGLQAQTLSLFDDAVRRAKVRRDDMNTFMADFEEGRKQGRYVAASLPSLPFADDSFDLTLCANFLFLYSSTESGGLLQDSPFDFDFHLAALRELCRVTRGEVRLYPLNGPEVQRHAYLDKLCAALTADGITCAEVPVEHQDIKTARHLLSLKK